VLRIFKSTQNCKRMIGKFIKGRQKPRDMQNPSPPFLQYANKTFRLQIDIHLEDEMCSLPLILLVHSIALCGQMRHIYLYRFLDLLNRAAVHSITISTPPLFCSIFGIVHPSDPLDPQRGFVRDERSLIVHIPFYRGDCFFFQCASRFLSKLLLTSSRYWHSNISMNLWMISKNLWILQCFPLLTHSS
jgi:hypothetical protein